MRQDGDEERVRMRVSLPQATLHWSAATSRNDLMRHISVNVRQAEIPSGISERQAFMIDTHQMQDRGV